MGRPQTVRKTGKNKSVGNSEAWCKGDTVWKALLEEPSPPLDLLEVPPGTKVGCLPSSGSGPLSLDLRSPHPGSGLFLLQPSPSASVSSLVQWPWAPSVLFWPHPVACRILVPQPGMELRPRAVEALSLNHWTIGEIPSLFFLIPNQEIHTRCSQAYKITSRVSVLPGLCVCCVGQSWSGRGEGCEVLGCGPHPEETKECGIHRKKRVLSPNHGPGERGPLLSSPPYSGVHWWGPLVTRELHSLGFKLLWPAPPHPVQPSQAVPWPPWVKSPDLAPLPPPCVCQGHQPRASTLSSWQGFLCV